MKPLWGIDLPHSLIGSMEPVYDELTDTVYFADGWGTSYSSLCLRRVALKDGSLAEPLRLRAPVFSVAFDPHEASMLVAAGKRLIEIDRRSWRELSRWEIGVPKHSHNSVVHARRAVLAGWAGPSIGIFDLENGACHRRKVGSCQGLFVREQGDIIVCSGKEGRLSLCEPESATVKPLADIGPFMHTTHCAAAHSLVIGLGVPFEITASSVSQFRESSHLAVVSLDVPDDTAKVQVPIAFDALWASSDARRLFLHSHGRLHEYEFDGLRLEAIREDALPGGMTPWIVLPERGLALVAKFDSEVSRIEAWNL